MENQELRAILKEVWEAAYRLGKGGLEVNQTFYRTRDLTVNDAAKRIEQEMGVQDGKETKA